MNDEQPCKDYSTLNLAVLAAQVAAWAGLITTVDSALPLPLRVLAVLLFCLVMQGVFSLMHEYFHDRAHRNKRVDWWMGWLASTIFMTSATLHKVNHHGHHARNRTRAEIIEYIYPDESGLKKTFLYYTGLLGGLWLGGFVFPFLSFILPYRAVDHLSRTKRVNTYSAAFESFRRADWNRMRLETVLALAFWTGALVLFGWRWQTLLVCYAAFAVSWSSMQWMYHVRTPLHVIEGAYNLRAPALVSWLFLHFNYNLTHHRRPDIPWIELPLRSNQEETQPLWYRWLSMAKWPVPMPPDVDRMEKVYF